MGAEEQILTATASKTSGNLHALSYLVTMSDLPNAINLARRLSRQNEPDLLRKLLAGPCRCDRLHPLRYFGGSTASTLILDLGDTSLDISLLCHQQLMISVATPPSIPSITMQRKI